MCSDVEMCAELKTLTLKNRLVHKNAIRNRISQGLAISQNSAKMGYPCRFMILNLII